MDDTQQDQYEERLKEVFHSFDASGLGSLCPEELSELCLSLHLEDATPALLNALLQNQDHLTGRVSFLEKVDFEQFKNALILVLSASVETPTVDQEPCPPPDSPEVHPKFVRGSKRYGRRSTPEFIDAIPDFSEVLGSDSTAEDPEDNVDDDDDDDSILPRKRERWNAHDSSTEEFEAEGQLHLWNPDEPGTPRGSIAPLSDRLEERLREACEELALPWNGSASHPELLALCEHLGLEITEEALQFLSGDGVMSVSEFVSRVLDHCKPPTPSASTPYRQLKRLHSTQPFDLTGRRVTDPSVMTSTIGMRLFSTLDDGTGFSPVEQVLDIWMKEGIQNSTEILQALDFDLEGKVNLSELTNALENELLMTKNGVHQAVLASFKCEIRHLVECVDRELREKEKIRSDLEKAEKLKSQLATEVDEHHTAIERMNDLNLKKLEQDHKEKLATLRAELIDEMDQMQQQAGLQREQLEAQMKKIREDETFLRDHLSITVKENRRLEMELLDSTEKLVDAENQVTKLQKSLDNIFKEKFGDLDPGSAEFFLQQERLEQLRSSYEQQCRELQDRIDELQSELQDYHSLGRATQPGNKPVSEEFESKSPGMESDPGIGSDEGQPFNMSLEAEMMLEHLKEQHLREMEDLRAQLESTVNEFNQKVEEQKAAREEQKTTISLQYQADIQALKEQMASVQSHAEELQSQMEQAERDRTSLEQRQAGERSELEDQQEEEVSTLRQQLLEAHTNSADLEDQLRALEAQQAETELNTDTEMEALKRRHALELNKMEEEQEDMMEARLEEERAKQRVEKAELERRLCEEWETEMERLKRCHGEEVKARLVEASVKFQAEQEELQMRLTEDWEKERAQLDAQGNESLQVVLEEEMLRLFKEQEERESKLLQQWERERAQLQESQEEVVLRRLAEERSRLQEQHETRERKLVEEWKEERAQLEEDYDAMLQERLTEEREKVEAEKEELEKRQGQLMEEEKARLGAAHTEAMQELIARHSMEREQLGTLLSKLREDIADERRELESHFSRKIDAVETRFSGDQEAVAERFHADVLKLERHYQRELKALSESHTEQKVKWEAEMEMALQEAEERRALLQETLRQERECHDLELVKGRDQLERAHRDEVELLTTKNQELQKELDGMICLAQNKEIELSRQLNDLHNRLQDNMDTKDELLGQSDRKALEIELLLNQSVEDFKQERCELQSNLTTLENLYREAVSLSEKHLEERMDMSSECDSLKLKIQELELLLKQAAMDFELERQDLQDTIAFLEVSLTDSLACCEQQENKKVELIAQKDDLILRIKELEIELNQLLKSSKSPKYIEESNCMNSPEQDYQIAGEGISLPVEEQETCLNHIEISILTCKEQSAILQKDCGGIKGFAPIDQMQNTELDMISSDCHRFSEVTQETIPLSNDTRGPVKVDSMEEPVLIDDDGDDEDDDDLDRIIESPDLTEACSANALHEKCELAATLVEDGISEVQNNASVDIDQGEKANEEAYRCNKYDNSDDRYDFSAITEEIQEEEREDDGYTEKITDFKISPEPPIPIDDDYNEADNDVEEENNPDVQCEVSQSPPEAVVHEDETGDDCNNTVTFESCEEDGEHQRDQANERSAWIGAQRCHDSAVDSTAPEVTADPDEEDANTDRFTPNPHNQEVEQVLPQVCEQVSEEARIEKETLYQVEQTHSHAERETLLANVTDTNLILQCEVTLLQHKIVTLESLLAAHREKSANGQQALEENYVLKAKMLLILQKANEMETVTSDMAELHVRYEDSLCQNAKLEEKNSKLENRVWCLESRVRVLQCSQNQQMVLMGEIARMRGENSKLTELINELEKQDEILLTLQEENEPHVQPVPDNSFLALNSQMESKIEAVSDLEDCCPEFEKGNGMLRRALAELQDESLRVHEKMWNQRCEANRLSEENQKLRQSISLLKEEDLQEAQDELLSKLEHVREEKLSAQKMAEKFKRQISEMRARSQQLEEENGLLSEKNAQNAAGVKDLSLQLTELLTQSESKEVGRDQEAANERAEMAACVSAMEAELNSTLEAAALLQNENTQLTQQLCVLREKVTKMDTVECQRQKENKQTQGLGNQLSKAHETIQTLDLESAHLRSDLRVSQQERDALKHEVLLLHKQLQNANDANQLMDISRRSGSFQSPQKKLYQTELARLVEQEQQILRQENERLQTEVHSTKGDLLHSREKIRALENTVMSLKQQKHQNQSSLLKIYEKENVSLKKELDAQKELLSVHSQGEGHIELDSLRQENDGLKIQVSRLHAQLIEALQAQLGGLLPPSPHRIPGDRRGQHRGEEHNPDHLQDEREMKMIIMEGRMKEIELSLHNVKLLLKEKVAQLKDQLHRNGRADVLIKDLYVENAKLLKTLEMTEQRQQIAEKKNYLLQEKISSLNKIVRDLNPSTVPQVPYHLTCS